MQIEEENRLIRGLNVYIKPTYTVIMPDWKKNNGVKSVLQQNNEVNLVDNKPKGKLSKKSVRQLINAINWLVASSKEKWIYDKETKKRYKFKVNFVTLTLPGSSQGISDNKFKSVLLHNFINQMRYRYELKNFVWKVEAQKNGNIHAHFTTDTYLPWRGVREVWNRILIKNRLMEEYTKKHSDMTFNGYCKTYNPKNKISRKKMIERFQKGNADNWENPNSTDVHAVYKIEDVAAYLAKYMSKKEEDKRDIKGRLWACSYPISEANKLKVTVPTEYGYELVSQLHNSDLETKDIMIKDKDTGEQYQIGTLIFYKIPELLKKGKMLISEILKKTLFNIRAGLALNFDKIPIKISDVIKEEIVDLDTFRQKFALVKIVQKDLFT